MTSTQRREAARDGIAPRRRLALGALVVLLAATAAAQSTKPEWSGFAFLEGEWVGAGEGGPGQGAGAFSFTRELQNTIMVRRSYAEFPAVPPRPAMRHDDLLVIYFDANGKPEAMYWDNEGHVIHYALSFAPDSASVVLLSDSAATGPRFRMTYYRISSGQIAAIVLLSERRSRRLD